MASLVFVLGTSIDLALSELRTIFPSHQITELSGSCVLINDVSESAHTLFTILGGSVKIAEAIATVPTIDASVLADIILRLHLNDGKIIFGISRYDGVTTSGSLLNEVKKILEEAGKKARFVEAKHGTLSSVVVEKQEVFELIIAKKEDQWVVAKTLAVQDFENWNRRDYGRPYADPKLGMLPPKVARMAVNLAMGSLYSSSEESSTNREVRSDSSRQARTITLLDPFCGMGTILGEGLLCGFQVIGSDISEDVLAKARKNIEWLTGTEVKLFVSDATHISEKLEANSVDAIVTEPYMGPAIGRNNPINQSDQLQKMKNIIRGLEKLYIGCLRDWTKVLKPGGKVVIALPKYVIGQKSYFVKKVVDNCEKLGYSKLLGPLEYSRPQATVKREFYVFIWHT